MFAIAAGALLSSHVSSQESESGVAPPTVVTIGHPDIGGEWRARQGIHLDIKMTAADGVGEIHVSRYLKGKLESLCKGEIKILFGASTNGSYNTPFVAEITIGKEKSVVPGCHFIGEGDPRGLHFYQLDNSFGRILRKQFNLKPDDVVRLQSKGTNDKWSKGLDEE